MKTFIIFLTVLITSVSISNAQVAINSDGSSANPSAMLDVSSTNKGFLVPRMTRQQRELISNPANGLLVFETDNPTMGFYYFDGNVWKKLETGGLNWGLQGNSGTNYDNFIGTTDAIDLNFKVNNINTLRITQKGQLETRGTGFSVFLGNNAGEHDDLSNNLNVFVGYNTGFANTTGSRNTSVGSYSLWKNSIGQLNSAFGSDALSDNLDGSNNTAIGGFALKRHKTGSYNVALGSDAMSFDTSGSGNVAIGSRSLLSSTSGWNNTAVGYDALSYNTVGNNNIALGLGAGSNITKGSNNIVIGYNIDAPVDTNNYQLNIGNLIFSNGIDGQNSTLSTGNVGIGVTNPAAKLDVNGQIKISGGSPGTGKVLTCDNNGLATWETLTVVNNELYDTDSNTLIQVEKNSNEDIIRFKTGGTEHLTLDNGRINILNTGQSVFIGEGAGNSDDLSNNYNVFTGYHAGYSNTIGNKNVASGYKALYSNTTSGTNSAFGYKALFANVYNGKNTAIGCESLFFNLASDNTATGYRSLYSNLDGYNNSAFGSKALSANTSGSGNTACGSKASTSNTSGYANSAFGYRSLDNNQTGYQNTAIGAWALQNTNGSYNTAMGCSSAFQNYTGSRNTSVGNYSLYSNYSGNRNTAIGNSALKLNQYGSYLVAVGDSALYNNGDGSNSTLGLYNTAVGAQSLITNTTGNYNTSLGYNTDVLSSGLNYTTALGANAHVAVSNALVLGGTGDAYVKVGIGTVAPYYLLDVVSPPSSDATIRVLSDDAHKSSLKLFESGNYGYEFQYNGNDDKLYLWSRNFSGNEGIRMTWLKNGNVGIGTETPSYRLQIGNAGDGSQARANAWNTFSDKRWKTNIVLIDNPLKKLQSINGYYYKWKNGTDQSTQVGVIAQEVEKVLPEIVSTDNEGYKSVDYSKLTPLLIEAVKQQQKTISEQNKQILQLQKKIAEIDAIKHDLETLKKKQTNR